VLIPYSAWIFHPYVGDIYFIICIRHSYSCIFFLCPVTTSAFSRLDIADQWLSTPLFYILMALGVLGALLPEVIVKLYVAVCVLSLRVASTPLTCLEVCSGTTFLRIGKFSWNASYSKWYDDPIPCRKFIALTTISAAKNTEYCGLLCWTYPRLGKRAAVKEYFWYSYSFRPLFCSIFFFFFHLTLHAAGVEMEPISANHKGKGKL
jgi:hypothetical protein